MKEYKLYSQGIENLPRGVEDFGKQNLLRGVEDLTRRARIARATGATFCGENKIYKSYKNYKFLAEGFALSRRLKRNCSRLLQFPRTLEQLSDNDK